MLYLENELYFSLVFDSQKGQRMKLKELKEKEKITKEGIVIENKILDLVNNSNISEKEKRDYEISFIISDIIAELVTRRLELNISQRTLAKMTGIKQPMIARIEQFEVTPRIDTIVNISKALDYELKVLSSEDYLL